MLQLSIVNRDRKIQNKQMPPRTDGAYNNLWTHYRIPHCIALYRNLPLHAYAQTYMPTRTHDDYGHACAAADPSQSLYTWANARTYTNAYTYTYTYAYPNAYIYTYAIEYE
jgi:hypothetical protein